VNAPSAQINERSAVCLLALADLTPARKWSEASAPLRGITQMMDWFREHYKKSYAPNTRETVRRQTMHQFVQMGLAVQNPDDPGRAINSPKWSYRLSEPALGFLRTFGAEALQAALAEYLSAVQNLLKRIDRDIPRIPVACLMVAQSRSQPGWQNELIKAIIEEFCPRFAPRGTVLYVGDAGDKFVVNEAGAFAEMGIVLDPHGKMPDVVVHHTTKNWLLLIEAVTSHGPVHQKRPNELKTLFQRHPGLVFVTAFPSRRAMVKYLAQVSWESEVWVADDADHMIHFNGERFLGPY
jgi:adenine-specific DNA-methyltransferase